MPGSSTASAQFIPRGGAGRFDSHIIFAAAHPVPVRDEIRVYFMGGNVSTSRCLSVTMNRPNLQPHFDRCFFAGAAQWPKEYIAGPCAAWARSFSGHWWQWNLQHNAGSMHE
jgi:hypothetical protein